MFGGFRTALPTLQKKLNLMAFLRRVGTRNEKREKKILFLKEIGFLDGYLFIINILIQSTFTLSNNHSSRRIASHIDSRSHHI